ncbi:MAG: hypothetical protein GWO20_00655 [Candidatus Korarchaeota archaeon]|nr:hypothetical protein [Candidatus Korarchaeota archaeon]
MEKLNKGILQILGYGVALITFYIFGILYTMAYLGGYQLTFTINTLGEAHFEIAILIPLLLVSSFGFYTTIQNIRKEIGEIREKE